MKPLAPDELVQEALQLLERHEAKLPTLTQWLRDRATLWQEPSWRVGVLGVTSAGKSTLLNALLGKPILPARVRPSSNTLVQCRHGAEERARIVFSGGRTPLILQAPLADALQDYTDETRNPENRQQVAEIELRSPTFLLGEGTVLIDTPGLDAYGYDAHEALTLETLLPTVDVVLFVTTAKANSDAQVGSYLAHCEASKKPVILVQNMADTIQPKLGVGAEVLKTASEVAEEHRRRASRIVGEALGGQEVEVVQVSARRALSGRSDSGLEELVGVIRSELARLEPTIVLGRARVLATKLRESLPPDPKQAEREEGDDQLKDIGDRLRKAPERLKRNLRSRRSEYRSEAEAIEERALQTRSKQAAKDVLKEVKAWQGRVAAGLIDSVRRSHRTIDELASALGLDSRDFQVKVATAPSRDRIDVPTVPKQVKLGFWSWVRQLLGVGGVDSGGEILDHHAFLLRVKGALHDELEWFTQEADRAQARHAKHLAELDRALREERRARTEARAAWEADIRAFRELRSGLLGIVERIEACTPQHEGDRRVSSSAGAFRPDDRVEIKVSPVVPPLIRLAHEVARCRFTAARDVCLQRVRSKRPLVIAWDADAADSLVTRFWGDDPPPRVAVMPGPLPEADLVAVHLAVDALRKGEIDLALAGGANLLLSPERSAGWSAVQTRGWLGWTFA